jgi:protein-S-isoprenylcysteine O-methyltransferase Ste14
MKRRLKINGLIMSFVILLIAAFPHIFLRREHMGFFDEALEIFGVTFILLGQIFRVSARGYKSEHSSNGYLLIQGGPYALVRNPMYLGILLIGLGIVMILFHWWVVCIFLSVFVTRYLLLIFKEEKKLLAMFPESYRDYQRKVPRILPALEVISQGDISAYLPLKLPWLKKEIGSILAVLLVTLFLESREDISKEGLRAYLDEAAVISITVILFIFLVIYLIKRTGNSHGNVSGKSEAAL